MDQTGLLAVGMGLCSAAGLRCRVTFIGDDRGPGVGHRRYGRRCSILVELAGVARDALLHQLRYLGVVERDRKERHLAEPYSYGPI